jgi:hypothetical protein
MEAARTNPSLSVHEIWPKVTPYLIKKKQRAYAKICRKNTLDAVKGLVVCLCMDASKVDDKHFLIVYLVAAKIERPVFLRVIEDVFSQENYASVTAQLINELNGMGVKVGTICTDGFRAQVQAFDWRYHGLFFFQIQHLFFLSFFFFEDPSKH